ncbi:hypothetical protein LJ756_07955 [Arthrobacter sp. zg-Y411]|uniref:hypothetical protein n=1 Tax=Arthrobacter zhangbolii TaxID=2886936 RepID=UPI001D13F1D7|nr:hypothetical protein [Arthrobacter zhangbolii]MCC3294556.1 hypothetical protein [Arthrobacter zhangbolii]
MSMQGSAAPGRVRARAVRPGTVAAAVFLNAAYVCATPVFWFSWTQRSAFALPRWASDAAGVAGGILPVLAFAAAWAAAAALAARGRRQEGWTVFNTVCALGLLSAAAGMLALTSAGLGS